MSRKPSNELRYSIADEMLYGSVAGETFSMRAFSGGGRGSTAGIQRNDLAHWNTQKKAPARFDAANRGGPLPVGLYLAIYVDGHKRFGRCAFLQQTLLSLIHADPTSPVGIAVTERDDFFIHGDGPRGSDGCIVPAQRTALRALLGAIAKASGPVPLWVQSEGVRSDRLDGAPDVRHLA